LYQTKNQPGLEQLRTDVKTDAFDAIYFLDTDRIARDVAKSSTVDSRGLAFRRLIASSPMRMPSRALALGLAGVVLVWRVRCIENDKSDVGYCRHPVGITFTGVFVGGIERN